MDNILDMFNTIMQSYSGFAKWFTTEIVTLNGVPIYPWSILTFGALSVIIAVTIVKWVISL